MRPDVAADLAARTLAAIDACEADPDTAVLAYSADADRERVASDLAGLRTHSTLPNGWECARCRRDHKDCPDATRYADGLRRTAALYGVIA